MAGELNFIETLRQMATHPAARGLEDDVAVLQLGDETLVLTHDMMVEDVHYLASQDQADLAWKLVATNLSDLAAKGAEPLGVLLGYMLGGDDARFLTGLREVLAHYDVPLLGGDTVSGGPPRACGLTAIGRATYTPVPARSGAQPGDIIYLTGPVGAAMMGFEALRDQTGEDSSAYRRPQALLAQGRALAPHASAMMDVSDGLLLDATRMAQASGITLMIDSKAVPLAAPEHRRADALRWGDDYQLLLSAPFGISLPVSVWPIGKVETQGPAPLLLDGVAPDDARNLGFEHK